MAFEIRQEEGGEDSRNFGTYQEDLGVSVSSGNLASGFSIEAESRRLREIVVFVKLTHDAATAIVMTAQETYLDAPGAGDWHDVQVIDDSSPPTLTSGNASWSKAVASDAAWVWRVPVCGNKVKLSFIGTVAGTDTAAVYLVGVA